MNAFVDRGMDYADGQYIGPKNLTEAITAMRIVDRALLACKQPSEMQELCAQRTRAIGHVVRFVEDLSPVEITRATVLAD